MKWYEYWSMIQIVWIMKDDTNFNWNLNCSGAICSGQNIRLRRQQSVQFKLTFQAWNWSKDLDHKNGLEDVHKYGLGKVHKYVCCSWFRAYKLHKWSRRGPWAVPSYKLNGGYSCANGPGIGPQIDQERSTEIAWKYICRQGKHLYLVCAKLQTQRSIQEYMGK